MTKNIEYSIIRKHTQEEHTMINRDLFQKSKEYRYTEIAKRVKLENKTNITSHAKENKDRLTEEEWEELEKEDSYDLYEENFLESFESELLRENFCMGDSTMLTGGSFLILFTEKEDVVYSFVLTGYAGSEAVYECAFISE